VQIASILCRALDEARLPWSITHGAEGFPERVGRDFDILLPARFHDQAVALIEQVAGLHGWSSCLVPLRWAGAPVFLWKFEGDALHSFEMHFIDRIDWAGCILAGSTDAGCLSQRIVGLAIATWPGFAKRVLTQILAGCWQRIEERPDDFTIMAHEAPHLPDQMSRLFGRKAGIRLLELIRRRDLEEIRRLAPSFRARLVIRAFLPGTGVRLSAPWLTGKFARTFGIAPWRPPFLVLACPAGFDITALLCEIVSNLGFAKCWILPLSRPESLMARLRERWRIHVHRSLFRLVALACPQDLDEHPKVNLPYISKFPNHELSIFFLRVTQDGTYLLWFDDTPAVKLNKELGPIATQVAYRYLLDLVRLSQIQNASPQKRS
jgi:hypothetical protein